MAGIACSGHRITQSSKSVSYTARNYNSYTGEYNYSTKYTSIRVDGTLVGDSPNVFVNGKKVSLVNGSTTERDSWNRPSDYYSGVNIHSNGTGSIATGNNKNVYANGRLIAINGSSIRTHEGTSATIAEGSSNVRIGG